MGFTGLLPKAPKAPPPPANPAMSPPAETDEFGVAPAAGSLISTAAQGLRRRASTQRTSLIGGV